MRILLVEDHADSAEAIIMLLEGAGDRVRWANTASAALVMLSQQRERTNTDVVLLDLMLPDMSGVELATELRRCYGDVPPIVALSAKPLATLRHEAELAGAVGYLRKPFSIAELFGVLGNARHSGAPALRHSR
jgi:DNA-binding response OmpR family regulator